LWQARERGGLAGEVMANHVALGGLCAWGSSGRLPGRPMANWSTRKT
jgi:hypothetical protein